MRRNGFPKILGAVKGAKSVEEGVEFLKSHDIVVHPRCRHVIDELTLYSYKVDAATGQVLPVLQVVLLVLLVLPAPHQQHQQHGQYSLPVWPVLPVLPVMLVLRR
jgi:hypothetical protein